MCFNCEKNCGYESLSVCITITRAVCVRYSWITCVPTIVHVHKLTFLIDCAKACVSGAFTTINFAIEPE